MSFYKSIVESEVMCFIIKFIYRFLYDNVVEFLLMNVEEEVELYLLVEVVKLC